MSTIKSNKLIADFMSDEIIEPQLMKNYPKDWYKHLKKGDKVKCIKNQGMHPSRKIGKNYIIDKDYNPVSPSIRYSNSANSVAFNEFEPIKMASFSDTNYEIF